MRQKFLIIVLQLEQLRSRKVNNIVKIPIRSKGLRAWSLIMRIQGNSLLFLSSERVGYHQRVSLTRRSCDLGAGDWLHSRKEGMTQKPWVRPWMSSGTDEKSVPPLQSYKSNNQPAWTKTWWQRHCNVFTHPVPLLLGNEARLHFPAPPGVR